MDHRCSRNLAEIFGNHPTQKTSLLFVVGVKFASLQTTVIAFTCTRAGENSVEITYSFRMGGLNIALLSFKQFTLAMYLFCVLF